MLDLQTMYFMYCAITEHDIDALYDHQLTRGYKELAAVYRQNDETIRELIVNRAFALKNPGAIIALISQLDDVARVAAWVNTRPDIASEVARQILERNGYVAAELFWHVDDNAKLQLLTGGVNQAMDSGAHRKLFTWLRRRYPAGSIHDDSGSLNAAGVELTGIYRGGAGALNGALIHYGTPADWLLLLRSWASGRNGQGTLRALSSMLEARRQFTKAESAEVNVLVERLHGSGELEAVSPARTAVLAMLSQRSRQPSKTLLSYAAAGAKEERTAAEAAAEAAALIARLVAAGQIREALDEICRADSLATTDHVHFYAQLELALSEVQLADGDTISFAASVFVRDVPDVIYERVRQLARQVDPDGLARAVIACGVVTRAAGRWMDTELVAGILWHAGTQAPVVSDMRRAVPSYELSCAQQHVIRRLRAELGDHMEEFHSLAATWTGSPAELAAAITGAAS